MVNPVPVMPPIKVVRSAETHRQMDVTALAASVEYKHHGDPKGLARFMIEHSARRTLPYGRWSCFDGREVLFNREYQPILERAADGVLRHCDRNEWVDNSLIETTQYFYDDVSAPMRYLIKHLGGERLDAAQAKLCKKSLHICMQFLKDFTPKESPSVSIRHSVVEI